MSQSYYCNHCNTQNDSDDIYCAKCGRKLSHTVGSPLASSNCTAIGMEPPMVSKFVTNT